MPAKQKECIFCGGGNLTGEHIWADWLRAYIPRELEYSETLTTVWHHTHEEATSVRRQGDPHARQVRVVCGRCNNGWMSEVQSASKPHLIPLIRGEPCTVADYPQRLVALWSAMAIMAAEFQEPDRVAISQTDREYLRLYREPPSGWRIWIGCFEREEWQPRWFHTALPVASKEYIPDTMENGLPKPNTQTTTLVVGKLFIHAMNSLVGELVDSFQFIGGEASKLIEIWPPSGKKVEWPPVTLTDREAHRTSITFFSWAEHKRRDARSS